MKTLQSLRKKNVEDELLQLGWTMEQVEVADCATKEEEVMMTEDVADMTVTEDELEIDQVGPGSCSLHTCVDEGTLMEKPHDDDSTFDTCVSFGHLVDGPCAGKGKASLPMLWSILPWVFMMRPCIKKQGFFMLARLVGVVCDLVAEGTKTCDKGGT